MVGWYHWVSGDKSEQTLGEGGRTGKPGVLQSMGSQGIWRGWVTEQQCSSHTFSSSQTWHSAKSSFLPYIHWNYCESGQHVDPFTQENSWALLLTAPHPLFWVEKAELRKDPFPWKEWPIAGLPSRLPDVFWSWLHRHITGWPWTGCSSRGLPLFIHKLLQQACVQAGRRAGGQVGD